MASPSSTKQVRNKRRFSASTAAAAEEPVGVLAECSSVSCRSCTAVVLADCVALSCCPCALINLIAFAFFRVPWALGRRCLVLIKRKKLSCKKKHNVRHIPKKKIKDNDDSIMELRSHHSNRMKITEEEQRGVIGMNGDGGQFGNGNVLEAEKMWLDWYQVGHWGFGRVSLSGVPWRDI